MPVIKINGQQFALQPGQNRLGGGTTADVAVGNLQGVHAIVDLGADGRATIRKAGSESIRVNGTDLAQPTPLIHGDKVEIAGSELYFADDVKQGGSTQFVSAADVASVAAAKRSGPARGTLASGGRLVSLVDGKEYAIPDGGITIGRDASADIVVAQTAVSRRHAEVVSAANGYVVNDLSTNGVFVNGEKIASGHALSRADVIRVGTEEFRFYADLAKPGAVPAAPPVAAAPPAAAPPKPAAPPVAATPAKPASPPTPPARPATPPPAAAAKVSNAEPTAKLSTLPNRTMPPAAAQAVPPSPEHVTTKKGIPMWIGLVILLAALAVAAYFITAAAN